MNSNKNDFYIKYLQCLLREVNLYSGKIDGAWGGGCKNGFKLMIETFNKGAPFTLANNTYASSEVFTVIQTGLQSVGLYSGKIDGLYGKGTQGGFRDLCEMYRKHASLPKYSCVWSGNKNVTESGIIKIQDWLISNGKQPSDVNYMLSCFALETGTTFSTSIQNPSTKATGLIQFMPKTAKQDLGTTIEDLAKMDFDTQLDYVFKYFSQYGYIKKCSRLQDYYLSIFYPAHVGKDPDLVVAKSGSTIYSQNSGFDKSKRGFYTVGDIASTVEEFYWNGLNPKNRKIVKE